MWSHLVKLASLSKGALVVGVAASAAMVSNAEFSNTPSHNEVPSASPIAVVSAPSATTRPANSPSPIVSPKKSEAPAAQLPSSSSSASPTTSTTGSASALIADCVTKYNAVRAQGDAASHDDREASTKACISAIEATGLTSSAFAAKYGLIIGPVPPTSTPKTEHNTAMLDRYHQCLKDWQGYTENDSAACRELLAASGLSSEDFWKKFEAWAVQQPQVDDTMANADITALVKDCFAKYTAKDPGVMDACKKAMAASGLNGDDFWKTFGTPAKPSTETKPSTTPANGWEAQYALIVDCLKAKNSLTSTSETARVAAASEACAKAMTATGLSSTDFWTKFGSQLNSTTKPSTKSQPAASPKPVTNTAELSQLVAKCLDLYKNLTSTGDTKAVSEACKAAIQASGMSSADFWTKFHPNTN